MQVVILAGGFGTRISEESHDKPKPMIEIGESPILWHIMKTYSFHGFNDFIICCGYKGQVIKDYFQRYALNNSNFEVNLKTGNTNILTNPNESWNVTLVDTGLNTMTGGRLKRIEPYLKTDDFHMTYGDGVSDVNLSELEQSYKKSNVKAILTAVSPPGRFGAIQINDDNLIESFDEKPIGDGGRINGGYFILNKSVLDLIDSDETIWEREPLSKLASMGELAAHYHDSFWHPMDSLRDKSYLNELWKSNKAPWKVWK